MDSRLFSSSFWCIFFYLLRFHDFTFAILSNETDRVALLELKAKITDDPLGVVNSWNKSIHFCKWNGVTCGGRHQRVIELDLSSRQLAGNISPFLGNLSFLENLSLENNSFNDEIPTEVGRLRRLRTLSLQNNALAGKIPVNLTSCLNLAFLDLSSNRLSGNIPTELGSLMSLRKLNLSSNSLTGDIPHSFGNLSSLQALSAAANHLSGRITHALGNLKNLTRIAIGDNRFDGTLPPSIFNLSSMESFGVYKNQLQGTLPSELGNFFPNLRYLGVFQNQFSGFIPPSISNASNLQIFVLGDNNFNGTIPPSIFNLSLMEQFGVEQNQLQGSLPSESAIFSPNLQYFGIFENRFSGSIPPSLSNASNLQMLFLNSNHFSGQVPNLEKLHELKWLNLQLNNLGSEGEGDLRFLSTLTNATNLEMLGIGFNHFGGVWPESISNLTTKLKRLGMEANQIVGTIPASIANLKSLEFFSVWSNQLSSSIPQDIGKLQRLQTLYLDGNKFTGKIPSSLGNLDKLIRLFLAENKLQGCIPASLGKCQNLLYLDVSDNKLSGTIPAQVFAISSLSILLNLSHNQFTGAIPVEIGNLKALGQLDVSGNMLSGVIPTSIGSCKSLEWLGMQGNLFHGTIPFSLASLTGLQYLNLSHNNLSGGIPSFLESFHFQILDLSFNHFSGLLPSGGVFKNASAIFVEGNSMLCGGAQELHLPPCAFGQRGSNGLAFKFKILIAVLLTSLGLSLVVASLIFWLLKRKRNGAASSSSEKLILQVSYQTLFRATDGFSSNALIGVGSFGSVYKGILEPQKHVAVKVFNLQRRGASKSFIVECKAVKNFKHRNLVKVITACSSIDHIGNDFKALVYEFMVNGSLDQWLHQAPTLEDTGETSRKLNFLQRLNIAIDVACALDYLHHQHCPTPIVHCDLKPSNILLDDQMTAKVGDFGLVKFLTDGDGANNMSTSQTNSIGVKGTIGYAAPEYGMGSEVSTYGDMYSFGILLLEMFTGKIPTDDMFADNMNLREYVKMALPEKVMEITDLTFLEARQYDATVKFLKVKESLILIFGIGIACSEEMPTERMEIGAAFAKLIAIRNDQ